MKITPVILCGGSGTRLWPLSRTQHPKQFLPLLGETSLLQATLLRANQIPNLQKAVLIANQAHRFLVAEQLQQSQTEADILLEPAARNTAPAIAAAAFHAQARDTDAPASLLLILPSDHLIRDGKAFLEAVDRARPHAEAGKLVTFGIPATRPETGYGYIEREANPEQWHLIRRFVEKPDQPTASEFVASGNYLWNSGMFLIRADVYLNALEKHAPGIHSATQGAMQRATRDLDFIRLDIEAFRSSPADSIDYAIMEKTEDGVVIPLEAGWSDIGSWDALAEAQETDDDGNVLRGDILAIDTRNTLLFSDRQLLTTIGVSNLIVAATPDAILVADKSRAQAVKDVVDQLKQRARPETDFHTIVHRPWGSYEGIDRGLRYLVKRIRVKPGASLSLQMHHHRAEHWVVVKGTARIICGDEECLLSENQSTYIPLGTQHRLENPGRIELEIIEVQSGAYLGEDDIVRFNDHYGR